MENAVTSTLDGPQVEIVPFPEADSADDRPIVLFDDDRPSSPWLVSTAIAAVLIVAVVAIVAMLASGDDPAVPNRVRAAAEPEPALDRDPPLGPGASIPIATTAAPPTAAPPTPVPPTAAPPTTVGSMTVLADGWVRLQPEDGSFVVELPADAPATYRQVAIDGLSVQRAERFVELAGGGAIGLDTVPRQPGRDVDGFLAGIAESVSAQIGRQLPDDRVSLVVGEGGDLGAGRFLDFEVVYPTGRLRARAVASSGLLHVISATGAGPGLDAAFGRVLATFEPR